MIEKAYNEGVRKAKRMSEQEFDEDLPGGGQFPCVTCEKLLDCKQNLDKHLKSKIHKQNLRRAREFPYSMQEAEKAAGMGNYDRSLYNSKFYVYTTQMALDDKTKHQPAITHP